MALTHILLVDTETTDLPDNDPGAEVIELAAGVFDIALNELVWEWETLVAHDRPMWEPTVKRFSGVDFSDAPSFQSVVATLLQFWRHRGPGCAIGGQNPAFDLHFIKGCANDHGTPWPKGPTEVDYHVFDVASMVLPYVLTGEVKSVSLRESRKWAGCTGEQTHRAMGDVRDTAQVLRKIFREVKHRSYHDIPEVPALDRFPY